MMRITTFLLAITLLFSNCEPEELTFFNVTMEGEILPEQLGCIRLVGDVENANAAENVISAGFIWSTDLAAISKVDPSVERSEDIAVGSDGIFSYVLTDLSLDEIYYVRAFAIGIDDESGIRTTYSSETQDYTFGTQIRLLTPEEQIRTNDQLNIKGVITGIDKNLLAATTIGLVYSSENGMPTLENSTSIIINDSPNDAGVFTDKLTDLEFNTRYFIRAWASSEVDKIYYSDALSLSVTDGWRRVTSLPERKSNAIAVTYQQGALVGLGERNQERSNTFYEFHPNEDDGLGRWAERTDLDGNIFAATKNCVAFIRDDQLIVGLGQDRETSLNQFFSYNLVGGTNWRLLNYLFPQRLTATTTFSTSEHLYIGTGQIGDLENFAFTNQYYQLPFTEFTNPDNLLEIDTLTPLPVQLSANSEERQEGRHEGIAFSIGDKHFVGGGFTQNSGVTNDLWEFIPPDTTNPKGRWKYFGQLPGPPRFHAVVLEMNNRVFYGMGDSLYDGELNDWWEFTLEQGWIARTSLPEVGRLDAIAFATGTSGAQRGFMGTGKRFNIDNLASEWLNDMWEYIPAENQ